jgi:hypothetical protein
MINKEKFYIPKDQAESYDGNFINFKFSEQNLSQFQREPPTIYGEKNTLREPGTLNQKSETETEEEAIPLTEERLDVSISLKKAKKQLLKNQ